MFTIVLMQPEEVEAYKWNYVPLQLAALEKLLTANDDGHGYFVGRQLSVADVCIYDVCATLVVFVLLPSVFVCVFGGEGIAASFEQWLRLISCACVCVLGSACEGMLRARMCFYCSCAYNGL